MKSASYWRTVFNHNGMKNGISDVSMSELEEVRRAEFIMDGVMKTKFMLENKR